MLMARRDLRTDVRHRDGGEGQDNSKHLGGSHCLVVVAKYPVELSSRERYLHCLAV